MNRFLLLPLGVLLLAPGARAQSVNIPLPPPTPLDGSQAASASSGTTDANSSPTAMIARDKAANYSNAQLQAMGTGVAFPYELLDGFLKRYVNKKGDVYYLKAKGDNDLDTFARAVAIADLGQFPVFSTPVDPKDATKGVYLDRSAELTFWINAYNGLRLKAITDHYPGVSNAGLKQIDTAKNQTVAGQTYSFAQLRQKIAGMDSRALFALMSGTLDGPTAPLAVYRYSGLTLQLDQAVKAFINDPAKVSSPDRLANSVEVSPYLFEVDSYFKPTGSRRKLGGVRTLLSTYSTNRASRGYFTTGEYTINPLLSNDKLNEQLGR